MLEYCSWFMLPNISYHCTEQRNNNNKKKNLKKTVGHACDSSLAVLFLWLRNIEHRATTHLTSIKHGHVTANLPSASIWGLEILRRLRLACWGFKLSCRGSFHSFHHVLAVRRTLHIESEREQVFFFFIWIPEEFAWALNHQFTGSTNTGGLKADSRHRIKRLRGEECLTFAEQQWGWIENVPLWSLCSSCWVLWQILTLYFLISHTIYWFVKKNMGLRWDKK